MQSALILLVSVVLVGCGGHSAPPSTTSAADYSKFKSLAVEYLAKLGFRADLDLFDSGLAFARTNKTVEPQLIDLIGETTMDIEVGILKERFSYLLVKLLAVCRLLTHAAHASSPNDAGKYVQDASELLTVNHEVYKNVRLKETLYRACVIKLKLIDDPSDHKAECRSSTFERLEEVFLAQASRVRSTDQNNTVQMNIDEVLEAMLYIHAGFFASSETDVVRESYDRMLSGLASFRMGPEQGVMTIEIRDRVGIDELGLASLPLMDWRSRRSHAKLHVGLQTDNSHVN